MDNIEDSYYLATGSFNNFFLCLDVEKKLASPSQARYGAAFLNKPTFGGSTEQNTYKSNSQTLQTVINQLPPRGENHKPCIFCFGASHSVATCPSFRSNSSPQRQRFVESKQLCSNCFGDH